MPTSIGYQDLAALIARQPAVTERWRQHIRTSAFGTIHAATFSFPRPMGSSIPDPYFRQLASLDPRALDLTGSVTPDAPIEQVVAAPNLDFPEVDRRLKGDRLAIKNAPSTPAKERPRPAKDQTALATQPPVEPQVASPSQPPVARKGDKAVSAVANPADAAPAPSAADASEAVPDTMAAPQAATVEPAADIAAVRPQQPDLPAAPADVAERSNVEAVITDEDPRARNAEAVESLAQLANPAKQATRLFFGTHAIGFGQGAMAPWQPDEVPTVLAAPHLDPEIKRAALDPAALALPDPESGTAGETIAPKGEVTGEGKRPRTPAERLSLTGASREKHERCLSNAIYFEARGEVERGQMAVAQVILNRAFSGYYPGNVCDVVYQNAHRHLACQFTFACDNVRDVVKDQRAWSVATRVSREALDGKFWLPEVGKATHYHATYVNPWWVRSMNKHSKLGIHIFYRPKRWGDGADMPAWGDVTGSVKPADDGTGAPVEKRRSIFDPVTAITPDTAKL